MFDSSGQPIYNEVPVVTAEYNLDTRDGVEQLVQVDRTPTGRWRDGICDCFTNCWPSCVCAFCCCNGAWILAQIAQKAGYSKFKHIMVPYVVAIITCYIVLFTAGVNIFGTVLPCLVILNIVLRLYIVKKFGINGQSCCAECLTGLCCYPCSTAQMARHLVGYRKVFDGDSDITMPDYYDQHV